MDKRASSGTIGVNCSCELGSRLITIQTSLMRIRLQVHLQVGKVPVRLFTPTASGWLIHSGPRSSFPVQQWEVSGSEYGKTSFLFITPSKPVSETSSNILHLKFRRLRGMIRLEFTVSPLSKE